MHPRNTLFVVRQFPLSRKSGVSEAMVIHKSVVRIEIVHAESFRTNRSNLWRCLSLVVEHVFSFNTGDGCFFRCVYYFRFCIQSFCQGGIDFWSLDTQCLQSSSRVVSMRCPIRKSKSRLHNGNTLKRRSTPLAEATMSVHRLFCSTGQI